MSIATLSELAESVGQRTGNFVVDNANSVANYACLLYKNYPFTTVGGVMVPPVPVIKGFWDSLCENRPPGLPSPPDSPFVGGQCEGIEYYVTLRYMPNGNQTTIRVYGKVGGARIRFEEIPGGLRGVTEVLCQGSNPSPGFLPTQQWLFISSYNGASPTDSVRIVNVERVDGQPDNCGNLPPSYPPDTIPPNQYNTTVTYQYNDGQDFSFPVVIAPFTLKPQFTFSLGGVTFNLGFDGVSQENNTDVLVTEVLNQVQELDVAVENVFTFIHNEYRPIPPQEDPQLEEEESPEETSEEKQVDNLAWVMVTLNKLPDKAQFGSPTCYFAGWISFQVKDGYTLREQINFEKSIYQAPPGATGYGVTFTNGSSGIVTSYARKQED